MNLRRLLDRDDARARLPKELRLLRRELVALREEVHKLRQVDKATRRQHTEELKRIVDILRLVYDEEPATRRRLYELRQQPDYDLAFTEPEPLVSIVIPTFDRPEKLARRSIPSALSQTYENVEVVIVGDHASPETGEVVARFEDRRITYTNRNLRGPYPRDPRMARKVAGTPPFNEGVQRAHGRWIAPLADDDAFCADHVEVLLRTAQRERFEFCYGMVRCHLPDGTEFDLGGFPADDSYFGQTCLYHSGLRFIEAELGDALFREASDKSFYRRAIRTGVRAGFVDKVVTDYWWEPRFEGAKPPKSG